MAMMQPLETQNREYEEWCLGWRLTGTRTLSPEELLRLQEETKRSLFWKWVFLSNGLLWLFGPVLGYALLTGLGVTVPKAIAVSAPLMMLVGGLFLLLCNDANEKSKGKHQDVKEAMVKRFSGSPADFSRPDLIEFSALSGDEKEAWLEILPHSLWLYRLNNARPQKALRAPIIKTALPPASAASSAYWHQAGDDAPTLRSLSSPEKDELTRHSCLVWKPAAYRVLFFDVFTFVVVAMVWKPGAPVEGKPLTILWCVFLFWLHRSLWVSLHLSRRLKRDSKAGQVAITRPTLKAGYAPMTDMENLPSTVQITQELTATLWEVLPYSKLIWTADGNPAAWRKMESKDSRRR